MRRWTTLLFCILLPVSLYSQSKYKPSILILSSYAITADKSFDQEIAAWNDTLAKAKLQYIDDGTSKEENVKLMLKAENAYTVHMNFDKYLPQSAEQFLAYTLYEQYPQMLVLLKDKTCKGDLPSLQKLAHDEKVQYILNFDKVEFIKKEGASAGRFHLQFYDAHANKNVIDKTYEADTRNQGVMFTCPDGTLICTIHNALSQALDNILEVVMANNPPKY
jgi:hypothetical protein